MENESIVFLWTNSWCLLSNCSISSRTSNGGRRSRRSVSEDVFEKMIVNELLSYLIGNFNDCFDLQSTESAGTIGGSRWKKKQLKITRQKPFKLRTEVRKMEMDHKISA